MQTSSKGRADIKLHEGEVLKAYRCPAGKWTIGVGLTSASGVVKVKPGMKITREESDRLLSEALRRNYEPRVERAMASPRAGGSVLVAAQHEFDGGVIFDFNTGAIHKASWVKAWRLSDWVAVEAGLQLWKKGGGKVLPGLVRRRDAEYRLVRYAQYLSDQPVLPKQLSPKEARITPPLSRDEIARVSAGLRSLGFEPGADPTWIAVEAVRAFQRKHDLTVDGVLGRATLSTLQRALDARAKAKPAAVATGAVATSEVTGFDDAFSVVPWAAEAMLAVCAVYGLWLAWRYRDQIAGAIQSPLPRVAAFLRSF